MGNNRGDYMKLETQEKIRLAELVLGAGAYTGVLYTHFDTFFDHYDKMQECGLLLLTPYILSCYTALRQEMKSDEYRYIKENYDMVVENIASLMHSQNLKDPVQVFATYMYMYRHGYLSLNKDFAYKNDMKDFAKMAGVDVIRGKGVCRSVSSLFTDVCNHMELKATNLVVKANDAIPKIEKLCDKEKNMADEETKKFVKAVVFITEHLPLANHQITMVKQNDTNYIFDPMNDGFLQKGQGSKLLLANDNSAHMTLFPGQLSKAVGQMHAENLFSINKQLSLPTIDYLEYKEIYLDTLRFCQRNIDLFEDFYHANREIYDEINRASDEQANLLIRMFGFGPVEKAIQKRKTK